MSDHHATVHTDGGSRGNPGPAAYAFVLRRPGLPDIEEAETLGSTTNNVAEYTALVRALERAGELGVRSLTVYSDSELMVRQMKGEYRVKSPDLQDLYREAVELRKGFDTVTFIHVRREYNADADRLCNEAMDGRPRPRPVPAVEEPEDQPAPADPPARTKKKKAGPDTQPATDPLRAAALAILTRAAAAWAANGPAAPSVENVWDELAAALENYGSGK